MSKDKKRNANPKKSQSNMSIQDIYEMESKNYMDYSTETFESLEMGSDNDLIKDLQDIGSRPEKQNQTEVKQPIGKKR